MLNVYKNYALGFQNIFRDDNLGKVKQFLNIQRVAKTVNKRT